MTRLPTPSPPAAPAGPIDAEAAARARRAGLSAERCHALAATLCSAIDALWRRRAAEVPEADLEDYLRLRWLRWNGGRLQPTPQGEAVRTWTATPEAAP